MPECPEIALTAQLLSKYKNKTIIQINIFNKKYNKLEILNDKKYKIKNIDSKGKILYFELENQNNVIYLLNQFGLTGYWNLEKEKNTKIEIIFDQDDKIYFTDNLNFGNITISNNLNKLDKLGLDYLKEDFTDKEFENKFNTFIIKDTKKKMLLGRMLKNQNSNNGIGSGIGNYLAPEILYYAKLSPLRQLSSLTKKEIHTLSHSIKYIIKLAYYYNNFYFGRNIKKYNYHHDIILKSKSFRYNVYQQKEDNNNNKVIIDKTIEKGRSFYWCPAVQV